MLGGHPEGEAAQLLFAPPWLSPDHQSHFASDPPTLLLVVDVGDPQFAVLMDDPPAAGLKGGHPAAGLPFWAVPGKKNAFNVLPQS